MSAHRAPILTVTDMGLASLRRGFGRHDDQVSAANELDRLRAENERLRADAYSLQEDVWSYQRRIDEMQDDVL